MDLSGHNLVKIGSYWLFDLNTQLGYKVRRASGKPLNTIDGLTEAFKIVKYNKDTPIITQKMDIPAGVIRKALKLLEGAEESQ